MGDQQGRAGGCALDAAAAQPAASSVPAMQPSPPDNASAQEAAVADTAASAEAAEEPAQGHSDDGAACMADRSASSSSAGASSDGSAGAAALDPALASPAGFRVAAAHPSDAALTGAADETDPRPDTDQGQDPPSMVDLGYLTDGVAAYIASLRDRLRQTQADLLTVPAQELRFALAVRMNASPQWSLQFTLSRVLCTSICCTMYPLKSCMVCPGTFWRSLCHWGFQDGQDSGWPVSETRILWQGAGALRSMAGCVLRRQWLPLLCAGARSHAAHVAGGVDSALRAG